MNAMPDDGYPTTIPPCPRWCALSAGHEYESTSRDDPEQHLRYLSSVPDEHVIRDVYVRVEALEVNIRDSFISRRLLSLMGVKSLAA